MKDFSLIDHVKTAIALIDEDMNIIEANKAYQQRNKTKLDNVIESKCYQMAYQFNDRCSNKGAGACPVSESFQTKKTSTAIHHVWIDDHAIVEEITATPIFNDKGEVKYVIEEFRDVTSLLGLDKGIIGICSYCRKVRDEDGSWLSIEAYLEKHTGAKFSHGICEDCSDTLFNKFSKKHSCSH